MPSALEVELKQTRPFATRAAEAMVSIFRTAAVLDHQLSDVLRPFGITPTQHNVLRILRGAGPQGLCGREIAERMVAPVPDVPRMLDRLAALRLIGRARDSEDRRHVTARITPKGLEVLDAVRPAVDAMERSRFSRLSERTLVSLIEGLATVRDSS